MIRLRIGLNNIARYCGSAAVFCAAYLAPLQADPKSFEEKSKEVENYFSGAVAPNIAAKIGDPELAAKLAQSATGAGEYKYYRGADIGDFIGAILKDATFSFEDFTSCQRSGYEHNLPLFLLNGLTGGAGVGSFSDMFGGVVGNIIPLVDADFRTYIPWNFNSGICFKWWLELGFFSIKLKIRIASLVPYHYPVQTMDVSEHMFQSTYHIKPLVEAVFLPLDKIAEDFSAKADLTSYETSLASVVSGKNISMDALQGIPPTLTIKAPKSSDIDAGIDAVKKMRDSDKRLTFGSNALETQYARVIWHPMEHVANMLSGIAHLPRFPYFGTDFPTGLMYSRMRAAGIMMGGEPATRFFLTPFAERICVLNNMGTGKTAVGLMPKAVTEMVANFSAEDRAALCIKNVGERYQIDNKRRPEITDGTFQGLHRLLVIAQARASSGGNDGMGSGMVSGLAKNMMGQFSKQVGSVMDSKVKGMLQGTGVSSRYLSKFNFGSLGSSIFGNGTFHTYIPKLDKFRMVRNEDFREEQNLCGTLDEIGRENITFKKSNLKKIGEGGLSAAAGYPYFHVCWGYRDKDEGWWRGESGCGLVCLPGCGVYNIRGAPEGKQDRILRRW